MESLIHHPPKNLPILPGARPIAPNDGKMGKPYPQPRRKGFKSRSRLIQALISWTVKRQASNGSIIPRHFDRDYPIPFFPFSAHDFAQAKGVPQVLAPDELSLFTGYGA